MKRQKSMKTFVFSTKDILGTKKFFESIKTAAKEQGLNDDETEKIFNDVKDNLKRR